MSTVITLQPSSIDTFITSANPDNNQNVLTYLGIGESNDAVATTRTLIKFNGLSDGTIPSNAVIQSAILSLYLYEDKSINARDVNIYRLKLAWVEAQATWNSRSTGNAWNTAGGFGANDCEQTSIGVLNLTATESAGFKAWTLSNYAIQEITNGIWTNNGFLIKADTETNDRYNYYSREYAADTNKRPKLVVVYSLPTTATYRTRRGVNLLGRHERRLIF